MFFLHYNTILLQEQVFSFLSTKSFGYLWDLWVIYEHLCSNLQFISLPKEVGEFLLYIMLKEIEDMNALFQLASAFYSEADTYRTTVEKIIISTIYGGQLARRYIQLFVK